MSEETALLKPKDYKNDVEPIWCPGCGDFGDLAAFTQALAAMQLKTSDISIVSGIGCSGPLLALHQELRVSTPRTGARFRPPSASRPRIRSSRCSWSAATATACRSAADTFRTRRAAIPTSRT